MNYTEKSFEQCLFNPMKKGKMADLFPELSYLMEPHWEGDEHLDELVRYAILMYDPESPLHKSEKDITVRREIAFELTGIKDPALKAVISTHAHDFLPDLITKYLMRCKSKEWAMICAMEYTFWESIHKLFEPISGKNTKEELESVQKKSAIKDEMEKDSDRLENYYKKFFGGDDDVKVKTKMLYKPEHMFKNRRDV